MSATDQPKSVVSVPDGPDTIWLEPSCCADPSHGRQWCEDDAFPVCDDGREPVKYVRADRAALAAAPLPQGEGRAMREALAPFAHLHAAGKLPAGRQTVHLTTLSGSWLATLHTDDFWKARQALAQPAPAPQVDLGSSPDGYPHRATDGAVVGLLDQISALCTAFNDQIHDADDTLGQINQLAYAGIAALRPDTVRTGIGDLAVIDLQTIRMWLEGLADCTDMDEVCADGGVTVGMAYQQDAREFSARIARMLPSTPAKQQAAVSPGEQVGTEPQSGEVNQSPPAPQGEDGWSELERLARAATPGPWKACMTIYENMNCELRSGAKGEGQAIAQFWDGPNAFKDGRFSAAANPAAILKLIAAARSLPATMEKVDG